MSNNVKLLLKKSLIEYLCFIGGVFVFNLIAFIFSTQMVNFRIFHVSLISYEVAIIFSFIFGIVVNALLPSYVRNGLTRKEYTLTIFLVSFMGAFILVTVSAFLDLFDYYQTFNLGIYLFSVLAAMSAFLFGSVLSINFLRFHWIFGVLFIVIPAISLGLLVSRAALGDGFFTEVFQNINRIDEWIDPFIEQRIYEFENYMAPNLLRDFIIAASIGIFSSVYIYFNLKKISIKAK